MENKESMNNGKRGLTLLIFSIIILVAIIVFLIFTIFVSPVKGSDMYAVFLSNGRSYFGQIAKQNSQTVVLRNVFYLQVQQIPATEENAEPQPQLSLINVSDEIHGPESEMQISRNHILFLQKLRKDSQVLKSIEEQAGK